MNSPGVAKVDVALRAAGINAELRTFPDAVPTAVAAAEALDCEVGAIANSLVFDADGEPLLVMASGAHRVDTTKLARRLGRARIRRATPEFVFEYTGQRVGGVAPVGHPRAITAIIDVDLAKYRVVWAGAGDETTMFATSFDQLLALTGGEALVVA